MVVSLVPDHSIYLIKLVLSLALLDSIPPQINVWDVTPLAILAINQDPQDVFHVQDLSIYSIKPASQIAQ
jgi:hypothetical protein